MKKLLLTLTVAAFAVAVQAGDAKTAGDKECGGCAAMKAKAEQAEGGCCAAKQGKMQAKATCHDASKATKVSARPVLKSPKGKEVASR